MRIKSWLAIFGVLIVTLSFVYNGTASTLDQLREAEGRNQAAKTRVSEQQNILAGTQLAISEMMLEMQELDQQIIDIMETIEDIEGHLVEITSRIESTSQDLALAQSERENQLNLLSTRVRVMHEQGNVGLFAVLFQAEDITDFFTRWEYIRTLAEFDQKLLTELEETEARVSANVTTLDRSYTMIVDLRTEYEESKVELEETIAEKVVYLTQLEEDSAKYAEYLEILEEEANAINIEFGIAQRRHREHLAEQERIRREEEDRRRAEAAAAAAARAQELSTLNSFSTFAWPLAVKGTITSQFGNRPDPFTGRMANHEGIDIAAPAGTQIYAAEAGIVRLAVYGPGYGNYIIIDHADNYSTLYAHNSRNRVSQGDRVTRGQHIGDVGTTGRSTGNHLHFEVRRGGVLQNPMGFFGGGA